MLVKMEIEISMVQTCGVIFSFLNKNNEFYKESNQVKKFKIFHEYQEFNLSYPGTVFSPIPSTIRKQDRYINGDEDVRLSSFSPLKIRSNVAEDPFFFLLLFFSSPLPLLLLDESRSMKHAWSFLSNNWNVDKAVAEEFGPINKFEWNLHPTGSGHVPDHFERVPSFEEISFFERKFLLERESFALPRIFIRI